MRVWRAVTRRELLVGCDLEWNRKTASIAGVRCLKRGTGGNLRFIAGCVVCMAQQVSTKPVATAGLAPGYYPTSLK